MSTLSVKPRTPNIDLPTINVVEAARPLAWLSKGWSDLIHAWPLSLAAGILFTLAGYGLLNYAGPRSHLILTLASGFLLVAPFLAIVFYELSRRREQGAAAGRYFQSLRPNLGSIGLFAALLAFILSSWERLSAILVALFLKSDYAGDGPFTLQGLFATGDPVFLTAYAIAGAALAVLVFALSVVSLPMLMDRKTDIATAIVTSLWVVRSNPRAMLVWAAIIAASTALATVLWMVPLILAFPLLGHATWHAYRELVGD
jgi:uncharacterized membrane protein